MSMATIHITQEEATRDLTNLLLRVRSGDSFVIEDGAEPAAVLQLAPPRKLTFAERLDLLSMRGKATRMDEDFAQDVREAINTHRDPLDSTLWD